MKHRQSRVRWLFAIWTACFVVAIASFASPAYADLPPRPTRTPVMKKETPTPETPAGTLVLNTDPLQDGLWSVVQWQGATGNWHDVEGWRGAVQQGRTIWWVEQGHWGKTPYRWVVFQQEGGTLLATSDTFSLPGSGETLVVKVELPN
jgi:hypothetical protein